jgi:hypothetical protein
VRAVPVGNTRFIVFRYDFYRILKKKQAGFALLNLFQQTISGGFEVNMK